MTDAPTRIIADFDETGSTVIGAHLEPRERNALEDALWHMQRNAERMCGALGHQYDEPGLSLSGFVEWVECKRCHIKTGRVVK